MRERHSPTNKPKSLTWMVSLLLSSLVLALLALVKLPSPQAVPILTGAMTDHAIPTAAATSAGTSQLLYPVYLVGAVVRPGIYQIEPGTCLYELIDMAGGLSDSAASDAVNLAAPLDKHQFVRVPTRQEVERGTWSDPATTGQADSLVDLNRAGQADLETLPGIGPATARAIIAFREKTGPFACIEDLMKVPGIKEARFESLRDLVCVGSGG